MSHLRPARHVAVRTLVPLVALAVVSAGCGGTYGRERDAGPSVAGPSTGSPSTASPSTGSPSTGSPTTSVDTTAPVAPPTAAPTTSATATTAWEPVAAGAFEVGAATIVLDDPVRPLTVEVWFPLNPDVDTSGRTAQRYGLSPTVYLDSKVAVAATADEMAPGATFPLVVYSHGSGGLRYINATYTEAIASHGYVVVAADHTGNTAVDTLAGNEPPDSIFADRVADIDRLIDAFTDPDGASPASPFVVGVDPDRIAVAGHSFGGWTAIAAAIGSDEPPAATEGDPRIGAVIPIAPAISGLFTPDRLARLTQPMLIIGGTDDASAPVDPHVEELWNDTTDSPAYKVIIDRAEHQSFSDVCLYQDELPNLPDVPEVVIETINGYAVAGCEPDDLPWERAHEITLTYSVDFLDQVLGADATPMPTAAPDDVTLTSR